MPPLEQHFICEDLKNLLKGWVDHLRSILCCMANNSGDKKVMKEFLSKGKGSLLNYEVAELDRLWKTASITKRSMKDPVEQLKSPSKKRVAARMHHRKKKNEEKVSSEDLNLRSKNKNGKLVENKTKCNNHLVGSGLMKSNKKNDSNIIPQKPIMGKYLLASPNQGGHRPIEYIVVKGTKGQVVFADGSKSTIVKGSSTNASRNKHSEKRKTKTQTKENKNETVEKGLIAPVRNSLLKTKNIQVLKEIAKPQETIKNTLAKERTRHLKKDNLPKIPEEDEEEVKQEKSLACNDSQQLVPFLNRSYLYRDYTFKKKRTSSRLVSTYLKGARNYELRYKASNVNKYRSSSKKHIGAPNFNSETMSQMTSEKLNKDPVKDSTHASCGSSSKHRSKQEQKFKTNQTSNQASEKRGGKRSSVVPSQRNKEECDTNGLNTVVVTWENKKHQVTAASLSKVLINDVTHDLPNTGSNHKLNNEQNIEDDEVSNDIAKEIRKKRGKVIAHSQGSKEECGTNAVDTPLLSLKVTEHTSSLKVDATVDVNNRNNLLEDSVVSKNHEQDESLHIIEISNNKTTLETPNSDITPSKSFHCVDKDPEKSGKDPQYTSKCLENHRPSLLLLRRVKTVEVLAKVNDENSFQSEAFTNKLDESKESKTVHIVNNNLYRQGNRTSDNVTIVVAQDHNKMFLNKLETVDDTSQTSDKDILKQVPKSSDALSDTKKNEVDKVESDRETSPDLSKTPSTTSKVESLEKESPKNQLNSNTFSANVAVIEGSLCPISTEETANLLKAQDSRTFSLARENTKILNLEEKILTTSKASSSLLEDSNKCLTCKKSPMRTETKILRTSSAKPYTAPRASICKKLNQPLKQSKQQQNINNIRKPLQEKRCCSPSIVGPEAKRLATQNLSKCFKKYTNSVETRTAYGGYKNTIKTSIAKGCEENSKFLQIQVKDAPETKNKGKIWMNFSADSSKCGKLTVNQVEADDIVSSTRELTSPRELTVDNLNKPLHVGLNSSDSGKFNRSNSASKGSLSTIQSEKVIDKKGEPTDTKRSFGRKLEYVARQSQESQSKVTEPLVCRRNTAEKGKNHSDNIPRPVSKASENNSLISSRLSISKPSRLRTEKVSQNPIISEKYVSRASDRAKSVSPCTRKSLNPEVSIRVSPNRVTNLSSSQDKASEIKCKEKSKPSKTPDLEKSLYEKSEQSLKHNKMNEKLLRTYKVNGTNEPKPLIRKELTRKQKPVEQGCILGKRKRSDSSVTLVNGTIVAPTVQLVTHMPSRDLRQNRENRGMKKDGGHINLTIESNEKMRTGENSTILKLINKEHTERRVNKRTDLNKITGPTMKDCKQHLEQCSAGVEETTTDKGDTNHVEEINSTPPVEIQAQTQNIGSNVGLMEPMLQIGDNLRSEKEKVEELTTNESEIKRGAKNEKVREKRANVAASNLNETRQSHSFTNAKEASTDKGNSLHFEKIQRNLSNSARDESKRKTPESKSQNTIKIVDETQKRSKKSSSVVLKETNSRESYKGTKNVQRKSVESVKHNALNETRTTEIDRKRITCKSKVNNALETARPVTAPIPNTRFEKAPNKSLTPRDFSNDKLSNQLCNGEGITTSDKTYELESSLTSPHAKIKQHDCLETCKECRSKVSSQRKECVTKQNLERAIERNQTTKTSHQISRPLSDGNKRSGCNSREKILSDKEKMTIKGAKDRQVQHLVNSNKNKERNEKLKESEASPIDQKSVGVSQKPKPNISPCSNVSIGKSKKVENRVVTPKVEPHKLTKKQNVSTTFARGDSIQKETNNECVLTKRVNSLKSKVEKYSTKSADDKSETLTSSALGDSLNKKNDTTVKSITAKLEQGGDKINEERRTKVTSDSQEGTKYLQTEYLQYTSTSGTSIQDQSTNKEVQNNKLPIRVKTRDTFTVDQKSFVKTSRNIGQGKSKETKKCCGSQSPKREEHATLNQNKYTNKKYLLPGMLTHGTNSNLFKKSNEAEHLASGNNNVMDKTSITGKERCSNLRVNKTTVNIRNSALGTSTDFPQKRSQPGYCAPSSTSNTQSIAEKNKSKVISLEESNLENPSLFMNVNDSRTESNVTEQRTSVTGKTEPQLEVKQDISHEPSSVSLENLGLLSGSSTDDTLNINEYLRRYEIDKSLIGEHVNRMSGECNSDVIVSSQLSRIDEVVSSELDSDELMSLGCCNRDGHCGSKVSLESILNCSNPNLNGRKASKSREDLSLCTESTQVECKDGKAQDEKALNESYKFEAADEKTLQPIVSKIDVKQTNLLMETLITERQLSEEHIVDSLDVSKMTFEHYFNFGNELGDTDEFDEKTRAGFQQFCELMIGDYSQINDLNFNSSNYSFVASTSCVNNDNSQNAGIVDVKNENSISNIGETLVDNNGFINVDGGNYGDDTIVQNLGELGIASDRIKYDKTPKDEIGKENTSPKTNKTLEITEDELAGMESNVKTRNENKLSEEESSRHENHQYSVEAGYDNKSINNASHDDEDEMHRDKVLELCAKYAVELPKEYIDIIIKMSKSQQDIFMSVCDYNKNSENELDNNVESQDHEISQVLPILGFKKAQCFENRSTGSLSGSTQGNDCKSEGIPLASSDGLKTPKRPAKQVKNKSKNKQLVEQDLHHESEASSENSKITSNEMSEVIVKDRMSNGSLRGVISKFINLCKRLSPHNNTEKKNSKEFRKSSCSPIKKVTAGKRRKEGPLESRSLESQVTETSGNIELLFENSNYDIVSSQGSRTIFKSYVSNHGSKINVSMECNEHLILAEQRKNLNQELDTKRILNNRITSDSKITSIATNCSQQKIVGSGNHTVSRLKENLPNNPDFELNHPGSSDEWNRQKISYMGDSSTQRSKFSVGSDQNKVKPLI